MGRIRFCRGLPQTGERPLTDGERALLTAEVARAASRVRVYWALVACAPLLGVGGVVGANVLKLSNSQAAAVAGLGIFMSFLSLPLLLLDLVRQRRRAKELERALVSGAVLTFGNGPATLVVLEVSRFILEGGARQRAELRFCALPPLDPPMSSLPSEARHEAGFEGFRRRRLTDDERAEIADHLVRIHPRGQPVVLCLLTAGFVGLLAAGLASVATGTARFQTGNVGDWIRGLVWLLVLGLWHWSAWANRVKEAQLREDLEDGWALRAVAGELAGSEGLPYSGAAWTAGGALAPWRTDGPDEPASR